MIKYVVVKEKNTIYAILEDTRYDALNKMRKITTKHGGTFSTYSDKYLMPKFFKAKVVCDPRDTWDEEEGKRRAKKQVLKNYYRSLDKRMAQFEADLDSLHEMVFN